MSVLLRDDLQFPARGVVSPTRFGPLVAVNELVEHLGEALGFLGEDGIAVHLVLGCDRWTHVSTDRALIEGLLLGLGLRARAHMPQGGLLSLETSLAELEPDLSKQTDLPSGEYVRIGVADTGGWSGGAARAWNTRMGSSQRLERPSLATLRRAAEAGGGALVSARHACSGGRADLYLPAVSGRSRPSLALT